MTRPADPRRRRDLRRAVALTAGLGAVAAALAPRFEEAAAERFAAHMVQHLVLMLVAAPLLAAARPVTVGIAALPRPAREVLRRRRPAAVGRMVRRIRHPLVVWLLGAAVLWGWHSPGLYQLALRRDAVHGLEHLMFLGVSGLFWSTVLAAGRAGAAGRLAARPAALALVFATALASGALGAILTFAGAPLYPEQAAVVAATGGDPLADQQLAGALMWVPPGVVYLGVMTALVVGWFGELDRWSDGDPARPAAPAEAFR